LVALSSLALACPAAEPAGKDPAKPATDPSAVAPDAAKPTTADPSAQAVPATKRPDPHSFSRPDQVRVTHMGLDWNLDFDRKQLSGSAAMSLERIDPKAPLLLDSKGLEILGVDVGTAKLSPGEEGVPALALREDPIDWKVTEHKLGEADPLLGRALEIQLPEGVNLVRVRYATTADASGLQWLEPQQTAGKKHPFLYSQSQAIHGRSFIPCQDSPGVRVTYDARIRTPAPYTTVMAANMLDGAKAHETDGQREFRFVMPQRVPSYLIALGSGDLVVQELSDRTAVWADPTQVKAAAYEFADMEKMLVAAEGLYGDYAWGRYDVLVLPPAFPFGGMENPRLTFATPTILAGDRSLVALIAHEMAHSWSGNLVTNSNWGDLWLNEGFTVYFERRIMEAIYGPERTAQEKVLGRQDLDGELAGELASRPGDQKLRIDLDGRDPDENFSNIPYEKGALFLTALEEAYGREAFDDFLRGWFAQHKFGSVDTDMFVEYAKQELIAKGKLVEGKTAPPVDEWIDGTGIPDGAPVSTSPAFTVVDEQVKAFLAGSIPAKKIQSTDWNPHQWLHFLRALPEDVSAKQLSALDSAFGFTKSGNSEIVAEWLSIAAVARYEPAYERLESFLLEVGRRKFLTPLYKAMLKSEDGKLQAKAIYAKARAGYHSISRDTLDKLMGVAPNEG
jgi:aminopeptidase N